MATKKKNDEEFEDLDRDLPKYPKQVLTVTLPLPPSVNHMYQAAGSRKKVDKAGDGIHTYCSRHGEESNPKARMEER